MISLWSSSWHVEILRPMAYVNSQPQIQHGSGPGFRQNRKRDIKAIKPNQHSQSIYDRCQYMQITIHLKFVLAMAFVWLPLPIGEQILPPSHRPAVGSSGAPLQVMARGNDSSCPSAGWTSLERPTPWDPGTLRRTAWGNLGMQHEKQQQRIHEDLMDIYCTNVKTGWWLQPSEKY